MTKKTTLNEFIKRSKKIHKNYYKYSLVRYSNCDTKVKIICPAHGIFEQTPYRHLKGRRCQKCAGNKLLTTEEIIIRSNKTHNNKYDYSLTEYKNNKTKIKIICKKHGVFEQLASKHMFGSNCPKCIKNKLLTTEEFVIKAKKIHGNKYDYSLVEYKNNVTKIKIICPKHGIFIQQASMHMFSSGCPKCAGNKLLTTEEFIKRAKKIHGNKYDYSLVEYKNIKTKVKIICKKHGEYKQNPDNHLKEHGCKKCIKHKKISFVEKKWIDQIEKEKGIILEKQHPITINNKTYFVDGFHEKSNTIYEFFGDFWHGNPEKFDKNDINRVNKKKFGILYNKTMMRINSLKNAGYVVEYIWENDFKGEHNGK